DAVGNRRELPGARSVGALAIFDDAIAYVVTGRDTVPVLERIDLVNLTRAPADLSSIPGVTDASLARVPDALPSSTGTIYAVLTASAAPVSAVVRFDEDAVVPVDVPELDDDPGATIIVDETAFIIDGRPVPRAPEGP